MSCQQKMKRVRKANPKFEFSILNTNYNKKREKRSLRSQSDSLNLPQPQKGAVEEEMFIKCSKLSHLVSNSGWNTYNTKNTKKRGLSGFNKTTGLLSKLRPRPIDSPRL